MQNAIVWFKKDLRVIDNPALSAAIKSGFKIIPIYIIDEISPNAIKAGSASKLWLYHSLKSLNKSLNNNLIVFKGSPQEIFNELMNTTQISQIYWNRCYEKWQVIRDKELQQNLCDLGIEVFTFNSSLLWEPWETVKSDKTPYKVFTAFYNNICNNLSAPRKPEDPIEIKSIVTKASYPKYQINIEDISSQQIWEKNVISPWEIGETSAREKLQQFLKYKINNYKQGRDFPSLESTSHLSPHLHFGEISPHYIWEELFKIKNDANLEHFRRELIWREFAYQLLFFFPDLPRKNWQKKFDTFPWHYNSEKLILWQTGKTGIPIVDAGMRELWQTGYMHNRVRMIVASFLVKNLMIDWCTGAEWFWETLFDADLANNSASWQWVAGCGADAAPYFRIFNPITQSEKFDSEGLYIRKYLPEIAQLPNKYIHSPHLAPSSVLSEANIVLGRDYPEPIIDLKSSRQLALNAFKDLD